MNSRTPPFVLLTAAIAVILGGAATASALAQDLPSYARPAASDETIQGHILSVDGTFRISVRDVRGFVDDVQLHQGTVIDPVGLTLSPGMDVTIRGTNAGSVFDAAEIDTSFSYEGALPAPVYYGPGWWYPGFGYGYGPAFSLGFVFGSPYVVARPFYGHAWRGGYYPAPPGSGGVRRTLSRPPNTPAAPRFEGGSRRTFGAPVAASRTDQVYAGHRAQPQIYEVAPAPRSAPAAHAATGSTRH